MKSTFLLLLFLVSQFALAQSPDYTGQISKFLSTLDEQLGKKAKYPYDDAERTNWNFVPIKRQGVPLREMNAAQRNDFMAILKNSMSDQGYRKASEIIANEAILREIEGRPVNDTHRDPTGYFFTAFGTPAAEKVWGYRLEGHHLSLNFSVNNGVLGSATPSFMGTNPAIVPDGPQKGKQVLKDETELGFKLVNSLSPDQLKTAKFTDTALPEIVSSNSRKATLLEPKGIAYTALNEDQKTTFMKLLDVYVKNYEFGFATRFMDKIRKAGIDNLTFAWAGSLKQGEGHYYRIQGPMLLIEYDNTQTNANHVHAAVRDLTNDFAEDILKEHYAKEHR